MPELAMASPRPHEGPTVFVEQAKHLPHLHVLRLPPPPTNVLRERPNGRELTGADPVVQRQQPAGPRPVHRGVGRRFMTA